MCSDIGGLTREEGLSYAVCVEEVVNSKSLSLIPNVPMVTLTCSTMASPLVKRLFCCQGNPLALWRLPVTWADRGESQSMNNKAKYNEGDLT